MSGNNTIRFMSNGHEVRRGLLSVIGHLSTLVVALGGYVEIETSSGHWVKM